jgi:PAS domain S-box-containing protein
VSADQIVVLSAETLPTVADASPHPAYMVTPDGAIVAMNTAAARSTTRREPSGRPGATLADHVSPACRVVLVEAVAEAARTRQTVIARVPGAAHEALCIVHPLVGESGAAELLAVFVLPSNGGRRSELELSESEERYRKLVELLPDAIMVHSQGKVEYLNAAGARLWGGDSPQAFVGMTYWDLVHPEDRDFVKERVHRIEQGVESPLREYRIVRLDGGVVSIEAAGTLISYRGKPANLVMFRDITARKEAEAKLRDTVARYRSLFENSPISLWEEDWSGFISHLKELREAGITDFAAHLNEHPAELSYCFSLLRLKDANRACVRFYGARNRLELMANMERLFPEESGIIRDSLIAVSRGQHYVVSEGLTHTLAGEERHVIYHFSVLPGREDTWETVLASVIDLTAQKQVERRLTELNAALEKEEAQRRLLSQRLMDMIENDRRSVAMELHDHFGQLMTTLKMDLEIVASELATADPAVRSRVQDAAAKATRTIADLKTLASGLMPSMIENLGLVPALQALVDDIRMSTTLEIHFFSSGISGRFDHEKELALYRIAQESINNVVKHATARRVYVNLIEKGGMASLSIEDDGVGFAYDEEASALWHGGPLGMHIMRARAVQFGGELTVDARPGHGVHVLAEIPL